jgi:sirohydrochlorin cobaltochelatase
VVPVFLAQGGHVKRDLPEMIAAARARHAAVEIQLMPALGESLLVIAAMAEVIVSA